MGKGLPHASPSKEQNMIDLPMTPPESASITLDAGTQAKYDRLRAILHEMGSVLVAYSGGVDSAVLLKVAHDVLGERAAGVIAASAAYAEEETVEAIHNAELMGIPVMRIDTHELEDARYAANNLNRCYFCKTELFTQLTPIAERLDVRFIAYGINRDDMGDWRPGQRAARELGVRGPLKEADMGKSEIRAVARYLNVPVWDKPAAACFSSRIPYGTPVTVAALQKVARAERLLHELGFRQVRVRHHDTIARIEVERNDFARMLEEGTNRQIVQGLKAIGYTYVTLDLQGYRTGSLNEPHIGKKTGYTRSR
jgi:uncharacterized protein